MKTWQALKHNPDKFSTFLRREKVYDAIRAFFKEQGFNEVETPLLVAAPGTEPFLEVFESQLLSSDGKQTRAFLLTSPEFAMKKLLAAGMTKIFQICKSFRNGEGLSPRHNPEFTIMEWYRTPGDYRSIMQDFEEMMLNILHNLKAQAIGRINPETGEVLQDHELYYQGSVYDLSLPYPRFSVAEAFEKYAGVSADDLLSREALATVAQAKGYQVTAESTWEELYNQIFLNEVETKLAESNRPTFIYDYPASQAALSKRKESDPRFAERFEVYLAGLELGNAFTELTDPEEQETRFREELTLRKQLGKTEYDLDHDYIDALKAGLPPTGGIAVGVDRLVMLFGNAASIEETLFFPAKDLFPHA